MEVDEDNAASATSDTPSNQALKDFYQHHQGSFVDSYAATGPEEDFAQDFAESFALWCAIGRDNPVRSDYIEGDPTDGATKLDWCDHGSWTSPTATSRTAPPLRELTR